MGAPETFVTKPATGRDRILEAAYELFSRKGVSSVGVDSVIARAGVAKMTLYRNFGSKEDLALAFLALRERRWTEGWVRTEIERRADSPAGRLLAIFEIFGEWFAREDFEGCAFVTILLEIDHREDPVRNACVRHLESIRGILREQAEALSIEDTDAFARQWHILMKGSIVAAAEGDDRAARRACEMGELLLASHGVAVPGSTSAPARGELSRPWAAGGRRSA